MRFWALGDWYAHTYCCPSTRIFSTLPDGDFWSGDASSVPSASATCGEPSEGLGFLIAPSLLNVKAVMKMRMQAAPTVQPISSGVLPWICAATRPLRARYLNSE